MGASLRCPIDARPRSLNGLETVWNSGLSTMDPSDSTSRPEEAAIHIDSCAVGHPDLTRSKRGRIERLRRWHKEANPKRGPDASSGAGGLPSPIEFVTIDSTSGFGIRCSC